MSAVSTYASRAALAARRMRARTLIALSAGLVLLVLALTVGIYVWQLEAGYNRVKRSADVVQTRIDSTSGSNLSASDLDGLNAELGTLQSDLDDLNGQLHRPVLGALARNTPLISARVNASQQLLEVGIAFTSVAREGTDIALEIRAAFEQTGFSTSNANAGPTWLDVVRARRGQIDDLQARFDAAVIQRQAVDTEHLTGRGKAALSTIDQLIARATGIREDYVSLIPLLDPALGAQQDAHYFVLLQNAEEIRQSGGFPGTSALITIHDGRLADIQIQSTVLLDKAYLKQRTTSLAAPGPIREYLKQEEWLPHDALWSADFPTAAQDFLTMYDQSGWPPLDGVVALNFSAVQAVLAIIGQYDVTVQGETQTVSADNVIQLIEGFRETNQHKKVVGQLGRSLIDQLTTTSFATKKQVFEALRDSADRREVQVYMPNPAMQAQAVKRGWDGALDPMPDVPTLGMTISSLAGGKSSTNIFARTQLQVASADPAGVTSLTWTIELQNRGDPDGDQKYNGFHRTWLELYLPEGARMTSSSLAPDPAEVVGDPRAIGYNIGLLPGDDATLTVTVQLPTPAAQLLLRRQSGSNNVKFDVSGQVGACALDKSIFLKQDELLDAIACTISAARP
jgi:hypothetical protein